MSRSRLRRAPVAHPFNRPPSFARAMAATIRRLADLSPAMAGQSVVVGGWLEDVRHVGGIAFGLLRLRDGTVQVTAKKAAAGEAFRVLTAANRESVVRVRGTVVKTAEARLGFEIAPAEIEVLAAAETPLPLGVVDKVGVEFDTRLDNRFLDLRKRKVQAIFRVRALLCRGLRDHLASRGFLEVQTPKLAGAGAEGGATLFETDYFGRRAYLSQSPQLYKQSLMATGFDRVFEIGPAFRAEPSDTVRHLTESTMLDGEVAWIDSQEDVLRELEDAVAAAIRFARDHGKAEFEALDLEPKVPATPVPRVPYGEALEILRDAGKRVRDGEDIDTEGEKVLAKAMAERGHEMFYIVDYPSAIKPFYVMAKDDDPDSTHSFDLEYRGDELASGGQREHRHGRLVARMRELGLDLTSFEFYLKPFRYGMPPHGGWGFGVDRLVWKLLDLANIREAVLFPRDRHRLVP